MKKQILLVALLPLFAPIVAHAQDTIVAATTEQKVDEPNARLELARAAQAMVDMQVLGLEPVVQRRRAFVASDMIRKFIADNEEALQILHGALWLPFSSTPLPTTPQAQTAKVFDDMTAARNYRQMTRLLVLESRVFAVDKNWPAAVQNALDAQRLGLLTQNGAPLIAMLTGQACDALARQQLRELPPQLDLAAAKIAVRGLQENTTLRPDYGRILRADGEWGEQLYQQMWMAAPEPRPQWSQIQREWQRLLDAEIEQAKIPYIISAQQPRGSIVDEALKQDDELPADLAGVDAHVFARKAFAANSKYYRTSRFSFASNATADALLLTEFALRAYELEHNKPATSWDGLVPAYLPQALNDPFDYEHALRLTTRDGKTVPYSIGPDGLDDKGAPIDNGADAKWGRFRVDVNNRGDIVSDVNAQ